MPISEPTGGHLEILPKDQLERIHAATIEVLRKLGIKIWETNSLRLFKDAGAGVDLKTKIARIPEGLIKETLRKAPSEFCEYGRSSSSRRSRIDDAGSPGRRMVWET